MNMARFASFDLLATPVAVLDAQGLVLAVNAALEDALGQSRRSLEGHALADHFVDPQPLRHALQGVQDNEFAALRYEAALRRIHHADSLPVHVIIAPSDRLDEVIVELLPVEQKTRQEREERLLEQAQVNKELIRNLAHEIKNPLGGIRGAAQLLEMELQSKELTEYTQVIIHEADRLQTLVDRLLAPHRRPHVVGDVNIHEVCERVRSLILAEFPKGLAVVRDYDTSIPEFRGDKEQLIQVVLNIVRNAIQAMGDDVARKVLTLGVHALKPAQGQSRWLVFTVADVGHGIAPEVAPKLFTPFFTTKDEGMGLGLSLCRTVVEQHGGYLEHGPNEQIGRASCRERV